MKLKLQFGQFEPKRELNWWQGVRDFPNLVLYKSKKWEFFMYDQDPSMQCDYICYFSEINPQNPIWNNRFQDIDPLFETGWGGKCECGAAYTSFPNAHMFFCRKWTKF